MRSKVLVIGLSLLLVLFLLLTACPPPGAQEQIGRGGASISVEKTVKTIDGGAWLDEVEQDVCQNVEFQIIVTNDGDVPLNNISVSDPIPSGLAYIPASAVPAAGGTLTTPVWNFPGPLAPGSSVHMKFEAHVAEEGEHENCVSVYAETDGEEVVDDTDCATVIGGGPCNCGGWEGAGTDPWGDVQVTETAYWLAEAGEPGGGEFVTYMDCNEAVTLGPPEGPGYTASVTLNSVMTCVPEECNVTYDIQVLGPDGPLSSDAYVTPNAHSVTLDYIPAQGPGTYTVVFNATCGGTGCRSCTMFVEFIEEPYEECPCQECDVTDMAVAVDGDTIYIISDGHVCKSVDGGENFTECSLPTDFVYPAVNIAVAPDNSDVVVVSDSLANEVAWLSTDGCLTWDPMGTPCAGGDTLTDLAVSPAIAGPILDRYFFATIADNAADAVIKGDVMEIGVTSTWTSVGVTGTHDYMAIQATPNFASDRCICVVGVMPTAVALFANVDYQIINIATGIVEQTVPFVTESTTLDYNVALPGAGEIRYADIALPLDFDPTTPTYTRAYVSIGSNLAQPTDDVYRIDYTIVTDLDVQGDMTNTCVRSIDYSGIVDEGTLLAGDHTTNMVWHTNNPMVSVPTWNAATTPPTGDTDAVVGIPSIFVVTDTCYAGTSGTGCCFFISTDGGDNFD